MNRKDRKPHAQVIVLAALLALSLAVTGSAPALGIGPGEHAAEGIQTAPLASMTLTPTGNTSLQEAHPSTNYGTSLPDELILGRIDGGRARALLEFNIGIIPLGATINQATLRIYSTAITTWPEACAPSRQTGSRPAGTRPWLPGITRRPPAKRLGRLAWE